MQYSSYSLNTRQCNTIYLSIFFSLSNRTVLHLYSLVNTHFIPSRLHHTFSLKQIWHVRRVHWHMCVMFLNIFDELWCTFKFLRKSASNIGMFLFVCSTFKNWFHLNTNSEYGNGWVKWRGSVEDILHHSINCGNGSLISLGKRKFSFLYLYKLHLCQIIFP